VSLYIAWNMTFLLSNIEDLDILLPKLLIPSIINSESENFAGARTVSLWLSVNHVLFRKYNKRKVVGPKQKIKMTKAWAEINKKYAFELAKKETHEDSRALMRGYNKFFHNPFFNFFKLLKFFLS